MKAIKGYYTLHSDIDAHILIYTDTNQYIPFPSDILDNPTEDNLIEEVLSTMDWVNMAPSFIKKNLYKQSPEAVDLTEYTEVPYE